MLATMCHENKLILRSIIARDIKEESLLSRTGPTRSSNLKLARDRSIDKGGSSGTPSK